MIILSYLICFGQKVLPRRIMVPITVRHLRRVVRFLDRVEQRRQELDRMRRESGDYARRGRWD